MQKITPNLWFDHNAKEAVEFYVAVFPQSSIRDIAYYPKTKEEGLADFQTDLAGEVLQIDFTLWGQEFIAINADATFKPSVAHSFLVNFDPSQDADASSRINQVWEKLLHGGEELMPLGEYPYSTCYGWLRDKYGYGWQLMLTNPEAEPRPAIIPNLLFGSSVQNKAEEAMRFYAEVFGNESVVNILARYDTDANPVRQGSVMFGEFQVGGEWFSAMDSAVPQTESFNEAVSFAIACKDQNEIDYFWEKLSSVKEAEQCGWLKDKYGLSWQIMPENMNELMKRPGAFKTMMGQHKIVIAEFY